MAPEGKAVAVWFVGYPLMPAPLMFTLGCFDHHPVHEVS